MSLRSLTCVAVLAAAVPAFAQQRHLDVPLSPAPAAPKNPTTALALSLGITLGGTAMLIASLAAPNASNESSTPAWAGVGLGLMFVGPSTGHWYAGELDGVGLGLRTVAVVGTGAAFLIGFREDGCDASCRSDQAIGTGLLIASAGAWLASSIYDIATAPRSARAWNREHGVVLAPTAMVSATGQHVPGVAVALRF